LSDYGFATGYRCGEAGPDLVRETVLAALERAGRPPAHAVLLLLTPHFTPHVETAIRAAGRAAQCIQVMGTIAPGVMSDAGYSLGRAACAALVFCQPPGVEVVQSFDLAGPLIWLGQTAPPAQANTVTGAVLSLPGHMPPPAWSHGRLQSNHTLLLRFPGLRGRIAHSQGIRSITAPLPVNEVLGREVLRLGNQSALGLLARELPADVRDLPRIPLHLLAAGVVDGDPSGAIQDGRYRLIPIIQTHPETGSVVLSDALPLGSQVFWALRQPLAATRNLRVALDQLLDAHDHMPPVLAVVHSCTSRGAGFFGEHDRDWQLLREKLADVPFIGVYGEQQIAPMAGPGRTFKYGVSLALYHAPN
jgi:hypothetical protein